MPPVTFGDVYYHEASDGADEEEETTRYGMQRLSLLGSGTEENSTLKEEVKAKPLLQMPRLEGNQRKRPLNLIDLPIDVLKDIVKEVSMRGKVRK